MKDDSRKTFRFPISKYAKVFSSIFCILFAVLLIFSYGEELLFRTFRPFLFSISLIIIAILLFLFLFLLSKELSGIEVTDKEIVIRGLTKIRIYEISKIHISLLEIGPTKMHWRMFFEKRNHSPNRFKRFLLIDAFLISSFAYKREVKPLIELLEEKGILQK